jgi:CHAD domain-containing protein
MVGHDEMDKGPRENRVMGATQQDETERKYDVGAGTVLPTLTDADGVSAVRQPTETELEAVYFDTAGLDLARRGITLRRRTGGYDAGWHLKLPGGRDTRSEVRLPLGRATRTVPDELLAPVRAVVRDRALLPVARLSTRRLEYGLVDEDSTVLAQVCDDEVHAERLHGPAHVQEWREWEVELVDGDVQLLDSVEQRLLEVGAAPASVSSKLRRALGDAAPQAPVARPSRKQLARGSAGQLLAAYLFEHVENLKEQDARLRAEGPGSIHKLRIAVRRLRSALKTFRPLLASHSVDAVGGVGDELRWLGQALSPARDAQVMRERLRRLVAGEPVELVLGPVSQRIEDDLSAAFRAGREQALEAVETERYYRLLDALDDLVACPPFAGTAQAWAGDVLPDLLQRDAKRLRRAVRNIERADSPQDHDAALHDARKKAKRLRYAAESAIPLFPARAKKLTAMAKRVQEALGEHQDAVLARHKLREYGAQTHLSAENGFTFGRLHALEQVHADHAERRFIEAWERLPHKKLRTWLRS